MYIQGKITVPGINREQAHLAVLRKLASLNAAHVTVTGDAVCFRGGLFRSLARWNPIVHMTTGTIRFASDGSFDYKITFGWVIARHAAIAALFGVGATGAGRLEALACGVFVLFGATAASYLQVRSQLPKLLQEGLSESRREPFAHKTPH